MATIFSQKDADSLVRALVKQSNDFQEASALAAGKFHRDITSVPSANSTWNAPASVALTVSAANATDLASSIALANNLYSVLRAHFLDYSAHKVADAANGLTIDGYATLASTALLTAVQVNLNAYKVLYNAHVALTTCHQNADGTNTVTSANATDQTSANTLANELKSDLNAHMASGPVGARIKFE